MSYTKQALTYLEKLGFVPTLVDSRTLVVFLSDGVNSTSTVSQSKAIYCHRGQHNWYINTMFEGEMLSLYRTSTLEQVGEIIALFKELVVTSEIDIILTSVCMIRRSGLAAEITIEPFGIWGGRIRRVPRSEGWRILGRRFSIRKSNNQWVLSDVMIIPLHVVMFFNTLLEAAQAGCGYCEKNSILADDSMSLKEAVSRIRASGAKLNRPNMYHISGNVEIHEDKPKMLTFGISRSGKFLRLTLRVDENYEETESKYATEFSAIVEILQQRIAEIQLSAAPY